MLYNTIITSQMKDFFKAFGFRKLIVCEKDTGLTVIMLRKLQKGNPL